MKEKLLVNDISGIGLCRVYYAKVMITDSLYFYNFSKGSIGLNKNLCKYLN